MFGNYLTVALVLFFGSTDLVLTGARTKRTDVDLQTCIDNFDIHKDKIIRTQDSRAMGAKYLNEIDLDSREECLRLCCETDNCDVFVYEEKNAGSCYLFQCGPPEDFKCKFTHHVNYTSAVLAVNRHLPDLESQIKLTKHEQDLTKLRKPETVNVENVPEVAPTPQTTQLPTTTTVSHVITNAPTENRKCSIYQFECRSTSECIAIYNACDGIPQCADGSDEAPELRCPDSTTAPSQVPNNVGSGAAAVRVPSAESQSARFPSIENTQSREVYQPPVSQHINSKLAQLPRQETDFLRPMDSSNNLNGHVSQYDPAQMTQYRYLPPSQNWLPHQPLPISQYQDKNSHIFNHKDTGLQVSEQGEASPLQYADSRDYPKMANYYGSEVYSRPVPQLPENWGNPQDYRGAGGNAYIPDPHLEGRENWPQNVPAQPDTIKTTYKPEKDAVWKGEKEAPKHEQDKMAHELKHSKEHFEEAAVKADKEEAKPEHTPNDGHDHGKYSVVAEYKIAETIEAIEDGVAETPGGAVLSLTLGLILTSLMGILIGCRLRVVRRRLRRGGKSYAHDADYLVNGMYL